MLRKVHAALRKERWLFVVGREKKPKFDEASDDLQKTRRETVDILLPRNGQFSQILSNSLVFFATDNKLADHRIDLSRVSQSFCNPQP
jgi:hypothetical protein